MTENSDEFRPTPWLVLIGALVAAAAPGFFFANPMQIHMVGEMREYWGIAVFPWALLAGLAFFRDGDFSYRRETNHGTPIVGAVWLVTFIAVLTTLALVFERWSADMSGMRPVEELQRQIPLWGGCGLVAGLFWQGIFQRNFGDWGSSLARVLLMALAGVAVWAPFVIHGGDEVLTHLLPTVAIGYLLVAYAHEFGAPVWSTMLWHGGFFAGLVWFRQAMLL